MSMASSRHGPPPAPSAGNLAAVPGVTRERCVIAGGDAMAVIGPEATSSTRPPLAAADGDPLAAAASRPASRWQARRQRGQDRCCRSMRGSSPSVLR
jgi:hypothetical protein